MSHSGTLIYMRNVPGKPNHRALTSPLKYVKYGGGVGLIPVDYEWDGSSSELISQSGSKFKRFFMRFIAEPVNFCTRSVFPRHRHPIASCRHDWRCLHAKTWEERLFADKEFKRDVGRTSWWITEQAGYLGVRIGAYLGIGKYY
jgi:hypothetical protein